MYREVYTPQGTIVINVEKEEAPDMPAVVLADKEGKPTNQRQPTYANNRCPKNASNYEAPDMPPVVMAEPEGPAKPDPRTRADDAKARHAKAKAAKPGNDVPDMPVIVG